MLIDTKWLGGVAGVFHYCQQLVTRDGERDENGFFFMLFTAGKTYACHLLVTVFDLHLLLPSTSSFCCTRILEASEANRRERSETHLTALEGVCVKLCVDLSHECLYDIF